MKASTLMKQLFQNSRPVFDGHGRTVYGDITPEDKINILGYRRGFDGPQTRDLDNKIVEREYAKLKHRYLREGFEIDDEADARYTDGHKGKHIGRRIWVYGRLPKIEKMIVLAHEVEEAYQMERTGKPDVELHPGIQAANERTFGPGGEFEFMPAYHAAVEAGERTGMRRSVSNSPSTVFG